MFTINDDLSIYATRGDTVFFTVEAYENGVAYEFQAGDVLRMKIYGKKNAENVVLEKCFPVTAACKSFTILLTEEDTKFGEVISKPRDYWYEIELNPFTNPQTIIGYDEDGAKVFKLFPEGADSEEPEVKPEDIPVVDIELDLSSNRPVENRAIARAIVNLEAAFRATEEEVTSKANDAVGELAVERARIDNLVSGATADDAELIDGRVDFNGVNHGSMGTAVRYADKLLKKQIDYANIGRKLLSVYWEPGMFDASDMSHIDSETRIKSMGVLPASSGELRIGIATGYKLLIYTYSYVDGAYVQNGYIDWMNGEKVITFAAGVTHYKMVAGKTDDSSIAVSEGVNIVLTEDTAITSIQKSVNKLNGLAAKTVIEKIVPDNTYSTGATDCANTKRWFMADVYPNGALLRSISFYTSKTRESVVIELWEKDGDNLTKVKTLNSYGIAGKIVECPLNHFTQADTMISIYTPLACVTIDSNVTDALTYAHGNIADDSISLSEASPFTGYLLCASVVYDTYNVLTQADNVLTVGDGMMYSEIQDAIDNIPADGGCYLIQVYPRSVAYKRFSMLRKPGEVYPWTGAKVKNVSIVAVDSGHVFVRDDSGNYDTPPAELLCNGVIKGITFIATHDNQDAAATKGSYAAHIDAAPDGDVGYAMAIEDCKFISYNAPAVGVGLHKDCKLVFRGCEFYALGKDSYVPHSGYNSLISNYGGVFVHSSTAAGVTGQHITFDNCRVVANEHSSGITLASAGEFNTSDCEFTVTAYNNVIHTENGAVRCSVASGFTLDPSSWGNNSSNLNATDIKP